MEPKVSQENRARLLMFHQSQAITDLIIELEVSR